MNISIICVGRVKEKFLRDAINEYSKRISKFSSINIIEVDDEETPANASEKEMLAILEKEGNRILSKISDTSFVYTLEIEGKKMSSEQFAKSIETLCIEGKSKICFVIGGSLGLSEAVKKRSDRSLSFSDMTFPHQLMRVILLEQIYRSFKIINNEPYHK